MKSSATKKIMSAFSLRSNSNLSTLKRYGLDTKAAYGLKAFSRNIGLFTREEQNRLSAAKVAIPGMGGVGGVHLITLVRTGIGRFHIADMDVFEPANVNRQFGASVPNFGRPKVEVMKELALGINPFLEIREFPQGVNEENIEEFLDGVEVVIDGLDFFAFETRRMLFSKAQELGAYIITAGPMGFSCAMLIFSPHEGMSFDEYFNVTDKMPEEDKYLAFGLGLAPRPTHVKYMDLSKVDLSSKAGPSLSIACEICAGMAATEAVRIILGEGKVKPVPYYFQFDPFVRKFRHGRLHFGNRNPVQKAKMKAVKILLNRNRKKISTDSTMPHFSPTEKGKVDRALLTHLVEAGVRAPSGDNAQPWKFQLGENKIRLYLDPQCDQSFFNVNQIASVISCGAVLENISVAARYFGYDPKLTYLPLGNGSELMAEIELRPGFEQTEPLYDAIWRRCTNRKMYKKLPLSRVLTKELSDLAEEFDGVRLHILTEPKNLKKLGKNIYKVDRIRTEHRPLHEHLMRMIRFSPKEAERKRDGFPLKNLEAGFAGEVFLRLARPWWVMNLVNKSGLGRMVALHSYQAIVNCSAAALLTTSGMDAKSFLIGGQALERIWLKLTSYGIAMQPMTAITLFWLRWQMRGQHDFSSAHQDLLQRVWEEYKGLFGQVDFGREGHVMLFRIGYAPQIKHRTVRKKVEDLMK